jgi:Leucine-rich repeat (LRR) protein
MQPGKQLTKELLLSKCKTDRLSSLKNVNLWGNELQDLSIVAQELPNVEILSLSLNKITSLKDFAQCFKLTELYLRKNNIQDIMEVQHLKLLTNLRVLWLSHNPCADHPLYRLFVIKTLPNLVKLDNAEVTPEERDQARTMSLEQVGLQRKPSQSILQQNTAI